MNRFLRDISVYMHASGGQVRSENCSSPYDIYLMTPKLMHIIFKNINESLQFDVLYERDFSYRQDTNSNI